MLTGSVNAVVVLLSAVIIGLAVLVIGWICCSLFLRCRRRAGARACGARIAAVLVDDGGSDSEIFARLSELHESGALSDEEFVGAKQYVLRR